MAGVREVAKAPSNNCPAPFPLLFFTFILTHTQDARMTHTG